MVIIFETVLTRKEKKVIRQSLYSYVPTLRHPHNQCNAWGSNLKLKQICSLAEMISHWVCITSRSSFKIIMAVIRAAVQDLWFMLKIRTALDHVNDIGAEKLTLIFLEDFPLDELPFLLRLFLGDRRPHLSWTDDETGHMYSWYFWLKNLAVNINRNHVIPP